MRLLVSIILISVLTMNILFAVESNPTFPGDNPPTVTAKVFAPGLVSDKGREFGLSVTTDWSEIYFTRLTGVLSEIFVTEYESGKWSKPVVATFSDSGNDGHSWLSDFGNRITFISLRALKGSAQPLNVWYSDRMSNGWSEPKPLGPPFTFETMHAPSVSSNGNLYATGLKLSRWNGSKYLPIESLSPKTKGKQPAISADESYLVFSARRPDRFGSNDLYVSFHNENDTWSEPVNLGDKINSTGNESSPTLSSDGKYLFYTRNDDIWWVSTCVIDDLSP